MIQDYWPSEEQIDECIRTTAEELAEHVLLAVHEPMELTKLAANSGSSNTASEEDLLRHLTSTERPIPIVGASGVGKSHLIRWLDWKLRNLPEAKNWLVRRIPKNASLRRVLEIILEGLDGAEFEQARTEVRTVGSQLKTERVAEHLLLSAGHLLGDLYRETEKELRDIQETGRSLDERDKRRIALIKKHASEESLPTLLLDPNFKSTLSSEGKCVFQIAQRLTSGSTDEELIRNDYQLHAEDLDFSMQIDDLSLNARNYVRNKTLNTSSESREEATQLLNEVLNDACMSTFQQFFKFNSGSFQELFVDIRKYLKRRGLELIILVEDMAAISAIEDVLIDSLIEESVYDGKAELCPIRSAIAVTEDYPGYAKRRNTLITRAQYEWSISMRSDDEELIYQRIEDFCGRYLNASRYGQFALAETYNPSNLGKDWPKPWVSEYQDGQELAESLDCSDSGVPLFPFSKVAIKALADSFCRPRDQLEFDPRTILNQILLRVLKSHRAEFFRGDFPSSGLSPLNCPTTLQLELQQNIPDDFDRAAKFASIYGYGATNLDELSSLVDPVLAQEFGLKRLAVVLESDDRQPVPVTPPPERKSAAEVKPDQGAQKEQDTEKDIASEVDLWFKTQSISQPHAAVIRETLLETITIYLNNHHKKWLSAKYLKPLDQRRRPLIYVPFNTNNPPTPVLKLAGEKEFNDPKKSLVYKAFLIALFRYKKHGSWGYKNGHVDYIRYTNFSREWAINAIAELVQSSREERPSDIEQHYREALVLYPELITSKLEDKLNILCKSAKVVKQEFKKSGIAEWDMHRESILDKWADLQESWLPYFYSQEAALEGDLAKKSLRGITSELFSRQTRKIINQVTAPFRRNYEPIELLTDCATQEDFLETLTKMSGLVEKMKSNAEYEGMQEFYGAKKLQNRIVKLSDDGFWRSVKSYLSLVEDLDGNSNTGQQIKCLNSIDFTKLDDVAKVLANWTALYQANYDRIRLKNMEMGLDKKEAVEKEVNEALTELMTMLQKFEEQEE